MLRTRHHLAALLVVLLAFGFAAPAAEARKAPKGLFGVGDWSFPRDRQVGKLRKQGLRWWRTNLNWGAVEPRRGQYDFSGFDQLLHRMARRRVHVLLTIAGCPDWACDRQGPPRTPEANQAWQEFIAAAV